MLYAGLLSLPAELIEAARLDGASAWTMLWRIKFPLIRKTAMIAMILRLMQLFNTFDLVLVLTRVARERLHAPSGMRSINRV